MMLRDRLVYAGAAAACGTTLAIASQLDPAARGFGTHQQLGFGPCGFLALTGFPCPSCGLTTAFAWAIRGEFLRAIEVQPFGLLLFAAFCFSIPLALVLMWRGVPITRWLGIDRAARASYAVLGLYGLGWIYKLAVFPWNS